MITRSMKRPKRTRADDERGAIGAMAAVLILVVIAVGAVAVDLGQVYAERSQLQNGADSAALGVAAACYDFKTGTCVATPPASVSTTPTPTSWEAWAQPLANGNANDGATEVVSVDRSVPGQVTVTTKTKSSTGAGFLTPMFASAFKALQGSNAAGPVTVGAKATVSIKIPKTGRSPLPLAFSACELNVNSTPTNPINQKILIQGGGTADCNGRNPSNQIISGGFAWLTPTGPGPCQINVTAGPESDLHTWIQTSPGASLPTGCDFLFDPSNANYILGKTVALPVYDDYSGTPGVAGLSGTGNNIWYHVQKWAGFHVLGWNLSGIGHGNNSAGPNVWSGSEKGIYGYFIGYSGDPSTFTSYTTDPSYNGNVVVTQLIVP